MEAAEVMDALELSQITDRTWNIQACSAVSKEGLMEGMEWIVQVLNRKGK